MLTVQPIMNSIGDAKGGGGKQPDDFQNIHFNKDDDFGEFADFQDSKAFDDDFGDFTFFRDSTNINLNLNLTSTLGNPPTATTSTLGNPMVCESDRHGDERIADVKPRIETSTNEFGDFTYFQINDCDNNKSKDIGDDEFGDFTFFQSGDRSTKSLAIPPVIDCVKEEVKSNGGLILFPDSSSMVDKYDIRADLEAVDKTLNVNKLDKDENSDADLKCNVETKEGKEEEEEEDDFGDFADFQESSQLSENSSTLPMSSRINSVSLSAPRTPVQESDSVEENQFDRLTSSSPLSSIVCQSFAKGTQDEGNQIISTDMFADSASNSYKMWQSLINWEEAASLKLNWESSHTFQVFLQSLKIDSKNILPRLRDMSTPLIPSKLTLLQPTPLLPSKVPLLEPQVSQKSSHQPTATILSPDPFDSDNILTIDQPVEQTSASTTTPTATIPEASFDWNSSGLTNPLEKDWLILL